MTCCIQMLNLSALFHAVSALLIHDKKNVKSHKGASVLFNQDYISTRKLPSSVGELFSQMETLQEESDYNCHYKVTRLKR